VAQIEFAAFQSQIKICQNQFALTVTCIFSL
jgi:hypothetical protein